MKIRCASPIINLIENPVFHPDGLAATFRSIAVECLSMKIKTDLDGQAAYRCFKLAQQIASADFADLSLEDAAFLKARIGDCGAYNNIVIGRMWDMLEGRHLHAAEPLPSAADVVAIKQPKSAE